MSSSSFKARLKRYWRRRGVRVPVVVCVMAVAAFVQYYLASLPQAVDVASGASAVTPVNAKLRQESLVIQTPLPSASGLLLSADGRKNETAAFYSDSARLSPETLKTLTELCQISNLPLPPAQPSRVEYFSEFPDLGGADSTSGNRAGGGAARQGDGASRPEAADTCHMQVEVKQVTPGASTPQPELELRQTGDGSKYIQLLDLTARGTDLSVNLNPIPPGDHNTEAPGCGKVLRVGNWELSIGPLTVGFVVNDGDVSQFRFQTTSPSAPLEFQNGYFVPFKLGDGLLQARGIRKVAAAGQTPANVAAAPPVLDVQTTSDDKRLNVESLQLKDNECRLGFSGEALVRQNGKYTSTLNLIDLVTKFPLPAALFVLLNTSLVGWFTQSLKKTKPEKLKPKPADVIWAWLRRYRKTQAEQVTESFLAAGYAPRDAPKEIRKAIAALGLVRPERVDEKGRDALEETAKEWADKLSAWAAEHPAGRASRRSRGPESTHGKSAAANKPRKKERGKSDSRQHPDAM